MRYAISRPGLSQCDGFGVPMHWRVVSTETITTHPAPMAADGLRAGVGGAARWQARYTDVQLGVPRCLCGTPSGEACTPGHYGALGMAGSMDFCLTPGRKEDNFV